MIRSYCLVVCALLALGLGACQPAGTAVPRPEIPMQQPADTATPQPDGPMQQPVKQPETAPSDSVRLWLEAPSEVRRGEHVPMTLRVRNILSRPVTLEHGGRPLTFNLIVTRPDGTQVWSRMHGRGVLDIQWSTTLQPGETLEFTEAWDQRANNGTPVAPGTYSIRGALVAVPGNSTTEPRPIVIRP